MIARGFVRAQLSRVHKSAVPNHLLQQRRHISILEPLASGIIETGHMFSSLPLFSYLPPYSTAIIAITLALRTGITLPMAIWSRARAYRREHIVGPALKVWREQTKEIVGKAFARERRPYEEYQAEMRRLQVAKIKELNKIHRCSPLPTIIAPFAVHAPLFVLATASFRQAAIMHTAPMNPLAMEPFLTLPSLAHTDPTGMLPIAVGLLMFSNVELGRLSRPAKKQIEPAPPSASSGETSTELPRMSSMVSALENGIRAVSILFIWIAMQSPGAVVLYWLTSASYTLVERLFLIKISRESKTIGQPSIQTVNALPNAPKGQNARRAKSQP